MVSQAKKEEEEYDIVTKMVGKLFGQAVVGEYAYISMGTKVALVTSP